MSIALGIIVSRLRASLLSSRRVSVERLVSFDNSMTLLHTTLPFSDLGDKRYDHRCKVASANHT